MLNDLVYALRSIAKQPLFYAVAWLWVKLFGTGEVGLRSLSALCGTAFVPVAYAIGTRAATVRVGPVRRARPAAGL